MTRTIIAEKKSQAEEYAEALGGSSNAMRGTYNGEKYIITHLRGHLYEFDDPSRMVPPALQAQVKSWDPKHLPWDYRSFNWQMVVREDRDGSTASTKRVIDAAVAACRGADTLVIATDFDPSGEGGLLAAEFLIENNLHTMPLERMIIVDQSVKSVQKAFANLQPITDINDFGEYKMALARSKWDLLSMQFTRLASKLTGGAATVRQGRLKSVMVKWVGDQQLAHDSYVKTSQWTERFRDELGVMYTDPDGELFATQAELKHAMHASAVVHDSTTRKAMKPPKYYDLGSLGTAMARKGHKSKLVLDTYQKMYDAKILSYPRTEDKTITPEQFNDMMPLVDQIAQVVGVDTKLLTHRQPRNGSHVKPVGAHGANRPGVKVPPSLGWIQQQYGSCGADIYETLAKNFLASLAPDYKYDQVKGHVADYPSFKGTANVPKEAGWKAVHGAEEFDVAEGDENDKGLGTMAKPIDFEVIPPRPKAPTQDDLMKFLERHDVGTGATRLSTFTDITATPRVKPGRVSPQLVVAKGTKLALAQAGKLSYAVLPGTQIGDVAVTKQLFADMKLVAEGAKTADEVLVGMADMVRADRTTMENNVKNMSKEMKMSTGVTTPREKYQGTFEGEEVSFNRVWGANEHWDGKRFTDAECEALLRGEQVEFEAISKSNKPYPAKGKLGPRVYEGKTYWGFQLAERKPGGAPDVWGGHVFTPSEKLALEAGESVTCDDFVWTKDKATGKKSTATVKMVTENGQTKLGFADSGDKDGVPNSWASHTFTDDEKADLKAGKSIFCDDFVWSKDRATGKKSSATIKLGTENGKKKIVFDK